MRFFKAALFTAVLTTASLANADLVANIPLDTSRYEIMSINELSSHAAQGNDHAQFYLAKRLQKGQGVAKNTSQALQWYTRAAEQGVAPAQLNLGIMYLRGEGVQPNLQQARKWLEKAAMRGDNRASYTLALLDEKQRNLVDAYKWYDLAARDGMLDEKVRSKARGKIGQLALNLSNSDINSARTQADRWFQNK
ncbi:tetratricopeptide repeat protein [Psychrobacter ciconiae]|uniref:tetratricopeptide repeat protein n=1 Tax=Psychrobacter ciconiae TaxID=1553449 RepID=UPI001917DD47|nr:tetratricopeptide repeat protein [Psychrobacter ciconiae]